jgi:hypothetical protein
MKWIWITIGLGAGLVLSIKPGREQFERVVRWSKAAVSRLVRAAAQIIGSTASPTRKHRLRSIRTTEVTASSSPTSIDPTASGTDEPVTWCRATPAEAAAGVSRAMVARRIAEVLAGGVGRPAMGGFGALGVVANR